MIPDGVIVTVDDGEVITRRDSRELVVLAEHDEISISWFRYSTGERGPDLHIHKQHADCFYVLEGELTFELGGPEPERHVVGAGGYVAVPPGVAHSFVNEAEPDVFWLNFHAPDGGFIDAMRARRDGEVPEWDSFDMPEDGGLPASGAVVSLPGEGERLADGNRVSIIKGPELEEIFLMEWSVDGERGGPPVHTHEITVDSFYVLEGEIDVTVEDEVVRIGAGTLACVPRGVQHTFSRSGEGSARILNFHAPDDGFGEFMRKMG